MSAVSENVTDTEVAVGTTLVVVLVGTLVSVELVVSEEVVDVVEGESLRMREGHPHRKVLSHFLNEGVKLPVGMCMLLGTSSIQLCKQNKLVCPRLPFLGA